MASVRPWKRWRSSSSHSDSDERVVKDAAAKVLARGSEFVLGRGGGSAADSASRQTVNIETSIHVL
jgi:alcohol dehydrogenase class IV